MVINQFKQLPLMGILRGVDEQAIAPLVDTVLTAGLQTIEITLNTPHACDLIQRMNRVSQNRLTIGAGTVLTVDDVKKALDAGASFIVSPTFVEDVVSYCVKNTIPVFPGALTPQEIYNAWSAGATMVKIFPVKFFGPEYIKEIKGPLDTVALLACGGITPENIAHYFASGASAVAFGASIFRPEWISTGRFDSIRESLQSLMRAYSKVTHKK